MNYGRLEDVQVAGPTAPGKWRGSLYVQLGKLFLSATAFHCSHVDAEGGHPGNEGTCGGRRPWR